eukprot:jgi/Chrzof1/7159/Cz02g13090.t1
MPYILAHLQQVNSTAGNVMYGLLDLSQLATAGHSRGGKLAGLHLALTQGVATAYLIDPVDSTTYSPPSPDNPSAVAALNGLNKTAAITGAGVSGPCNPVDSNYELFWSVLGAGSWLEVVPAAGHMQFTNISSSIIAGGLDLLCHKGPTSHEHVIALTAAPLVAWMDKVFCSSPKLPNSSHRTKYQDARCLSRSLDQFFDWVGRQQDQGNISFQMSSESDVAPTMRFHTHR